MSVAFLEVGPVVVVKPDRAVYEGGECDAMEMRLMELVRRGASIVVDLSRVRSLTAHCVGVLAHAQMHASKSGASIVLCGASLCQRRLMEAMGLIEVLPHFENSADAVRSFTPVA